MNVLDVRGCYESYDDPDKGLIHAAKLFDKTIETLPRAIITITCVVHHLLDSNRYPEAGTLLWGEQRWNCKPASVKQISDLYTSTSQGLILGAASVGKSYTLMGTSLLDWIRDPLWTSVKIISTSSGHSKANTFSTIVALHENAIIPLPGKQLEGFIGLDSTGDQRSSIMVVAIPAGEDGKGRLQGFHPVPRDKPHPKFGDVSRIRVILDEAEEVPVGVWQGIDNILGSKEGIETIKVIGATNPKNPASILAMSAEPDGGYESLDVDRDHRWKSKEGWDVLRVDAAFSENVLNEKTIFPSMQTKEGYDHLLRKNGGNSPEYFTFGRGIYPPNAVIDTIISSEQITRWRGDFNFKGGVRMSLAVDIAVDGRDKAIATVLRFGIANGFRPIKGEPIEFPDRFCVQVDHQQEVQKGETKIVGDNIIKLAKILEIDEELIGCDRTGNGASIHDYLRAILSEDVYGLDFRYPASDVKILDDDQELPIEAYDGVVTEVWFALKKYLEAGAFAFGPGLIMDDLRRELIGRRYRVSDGKRLKVEDKEKFKSRYKRSPDFADSLLIGLHRIRLLQIEAPTITGQKKPEPKFSAPVQDWSGMPSLTSLEII